jgi:hypothetical protein
MVPKKTLPVPNFLHHYHHRLKIHVTEGWQPPNQGLELTKNVSTGLCHIKLLGGQRGHELSDLFRDAAVFISRHFNRAMVHGTFLMPR